MSTNEKIKKLEDAGFTVKVKHLRHFNEMGNPSKGIFPKYAFKNEFGEDCEIYPRGGKTIVSIFKDGLFLVSAEAECSQRDNYSKKIGRDIAFGRAVKKVA